MFCAGALSDRLSDRLGPLPTRCQSEWHTQFLLRTLPQLSMDATCRSVGHLSRAGSSFRYRLSLRLSAAELQYSAAANLEHASQLES